MRALYTFAGYDESQLREIEDASTLPDVREALEIVFSAYGLGMLTEDARHHLHRVLCLKRIRQNATSRLPAAE